MKRSFLRLVTTRSIMFFLDIIFFTPIILGAFLGRFIPKKTDVGIGPVPLLNSIHHKRAFEEYGYSAKTFCDTVWHTTAEFDFRMDLLLPGILRPLRPYFLFFYEIANFKCLYIYFTGASLRNTTILRLFEPALLKLAGVRTVIMPFGSDVQDTQINRNLKFKNALIKDYPGDYLLLPRVRADVARWSKYGDFVISGCDWVYYMGYWDKLMISHFAIDEKRWTPADTSPALTKNSTFKVLHAPNHRNIKGTKHIENAIKELRNEGIDIELLILEGVPNDQVKEIIASVDLVIDQLIIGWYALFCIEAMAMEKPVICHLSNDLMDLYESEGIWRREECPIINSGWSTLKDDLRKLFANKEMLPDIGKRSRKYAIQHHSARAIGKHFDEINKELIPKSGNIDLYDRKFFKG